jgi:hypothetical protein
MYQSLKKDKTPFLDTPLSGTKWKYSVGELQEPIEATPNNPAAKSNINIDDNSVVGKLKFFRSNPKTQ